MGLAIVAVAVIMFRLGHNGPDDSRDVERRAAYLAQFPDADADGNGKLTDEEIRRHSVAQRRDAEEALEERFSEDPRWRRQRFYADLSPIDALDERVPGTRYRLASIPDDTHASQHIFDLWLPESMQPRDRLAGLLLLAGDWPSEATVEDTRIVAEMLEMGVLQIRHRNRLTQPPDTSTLEAALDELAEQARRPAMTRVPLVLVGCGPGSVPAVQWSLALQPQVRGMVCVDPAAEALAGFREQKLPPTLLVLSSRDAASEPWLAAMDEHNRGDGRISLALERYLDDETALHSVMIRPWLSSLLDVESPSAGRRSILQMRFRDDWATMSGRVISRWWIEYAAILPPDEPTPELGWVVHLPDMASVEAWSLIVRRMGGGYYDGLQPVTDEPLIDMR